MSTTVLNVVNKVIDTAQTKMTCAFKGYDDHTHKGVDLIPKSTSETPDVLAFADGTVLYTLNTVSGYAKSGDPAMGCTVCIEHADGSWTRYQHLKYKSVCVRKGQKVKKGQKIAVYGRPTTGNSSGPHLHFDISFPAKKSSSYISGKFMNETRYYVDPVPYLSGTLPASGDKYTVTASALNVRAQAIPDARIVKVIYKGDVVTVSETKNGFGKIGSGQWCSMNYLKKK